MRNPLLVISLVALFPMTLSAATPVDFTRDVKPILDRHCVSCHGKEKQRSSLRLDSATAIRAGGSSGAVVEPGKSAKSLLIRMTVGEKGLKAMPPKGPRVTESEVAVVRRWIDEGAKIPAGEKVVITRPGSTHWSFQPVVRHVPPKVKDIGWVRNPIDQFILARQEKIGIRPSPEAERTTLIRRLHLDLTGIPPTPEQVDAFVNDSRPDAYDRVLDRLLASPQYGERWGRHWLDQARYADSNGYSIDSPRAIWKYRDWVIGALNRDLTFDRFTIEQLAGDLLPKATHEQKVATGFHRNTQINEEGGIDKEQFRVEAIVDRTNTTGSVWLGLTVGCCQCHDHKFDPLSTKEYYQLYAFFNNSDDPKMDLLTKDVMTLRASTESRLKSLEKSLYAIDHLSMQTLEKWEGSLTPESRKMLPRRIQTIIAIAPNGRNTRQEQELWTAYRRVDQIRHVVGGLAGTFATAANTHLFSSRLKLEKQIDLTRKAIPKAITTMVLNERKNPRMTYIQMGGDFLKKGAVVGPGVPGVLPALPSKPKLTRLDFANWLVNGKNPLTGRVFMNRLWQQYFGLGLVETDNDFGTQGTQPSHPELLDWLADEFVRRGWSMKEMHRLLVTSATYRQSSRARPDLKVTDPRNLLLARQNRLRLEAEVVRDVILAGSGLLTPTIGGPSVFPPQPDGVYSFTQVPKNWVANTGPDRYRRGMYTHFWRSAPHPGLTVFDAPDATAACTRRNRSNTPLQALTLLNDEAHLECARALAERLLRDASGDRERLDLAFRLTLARTPTSREVTILESLLTKQRQSLADNPAEAKSLCKDMPTTGNLAEQATWIQMSRVLLNLDEMITRE